MNKKSQTIRHILALSGGKDSAALAVYLKDKISELEYVFLDTGHELPETYEFLARIESILGIKIVRLEPKRDFKFWLDMFRGCLPSPQNRWCTKLLKIVPYEYYIGGEEARSYVGIRADEQRTGYISGNSNVVPVYPFIEDGLTKQDIFRILEESGLGLPKYYSWRSRSGCYFCFFQRRVEWIRLSTEHPHLFEKAHEFEANHADGRTYTWIEGKSLRELIKDSEKIIEEARVQESTRAKRSGRKTLSEEFSGSRFILGEGSILSDDAATGIYEEDDRVTEKPCLICTL